MSNEIEMHIIANEKTNTSFQFEVKKIVCEKLSFDYLKLNCLLLKEIKKINECNNKSLMKVHEYPRNLCYLMDLVCGSIQGTSFSTDSSNVSASLNDDQLNAPNVKVVSNSKFFDNSLLIVCINNIAEKIMEYELHYHPLIKDPSPFIDYHQLINLPTKLIEMLYKLLQEKHQFLPTMMDDFFKRTLEQRNPKDYSVVASSSTLVDPPSPSSSPLQEVYTFGYS